MEDRGEFYVQIPAAAAEPEATTTISPQARSRRRAIVGIVVGIVASLLLCYAFYPSLRAASWSSPAPAAKEVTSKPASNFLVSQRTAFHFQPLKNWMNDPNGPLYYKGYYHLFYQYNPDSALWGNIAWGHAVSKDMIHWGHLEIAMRPDEWYDMNGVWSGSATVLPMANGNGKVFMLYTGSTNASVQVQNLAVPADPADPLLREWTKSAKNPLLTPPPGIGSKDFRDPTTAWIEPDGLWRIAIGARKGKTGLAMIYTTRDFEKWELEEQLHAVPETGMWECVDFYPVAMAAPATANAPGLGLDTSVVQTSNQLVRHVLKASFDDDKHDYYAIGDYASATHTWQPVAGSPDVGHGLRYDYGKFYASKTFYDAGKRRRILWGWANESDSQVDDVKKGWSSVQTIPRDVYLDYVTGGTSLIQWPIEEVEALRYDRVAATNVLLPGGSVQEVATGGAQLDVEVRFEYPDVGKLDVLPEEYDCSQGGAAHRGVYGPFGLLVLADGELRERTAVYFYMTMSSVGKWETRVCSDQSRSSLAKNLDTTVYGTTFKVVPTEKYLSLRVIVDHSIVETFAQGGRACITSRVYPTLALDHDARLFVFNNGTRPVVLHDIAAWKMRAAAPAF